MKAYANAGLSRDFPEPDYEWDDGAFDAAVDSLAREFCDGPVAVQETLSEGIKIDLTIAAQLDAWVKNPGNANSAEIVEGIVDAMWQANLELARREVKEGRG